MPTTAHQQLLTALKKVHKDKERAQKKMAKLKEQLVEAEDDLIYAKLSIDKLTEE
jgi:hypothetical protein